MCVFFHILGRGESRRHTQLLLRTPRRWIWGYGGLRGVLPGRMVAGTQNEVGHWRTCRLTRAFIAEQKVSCSNSDLPLMATYQRPFYKQTLTFPTVLKAEKAQLTLTKLKKKRTNLSIMLIKIRDWHIPSWLPSASFNSHFPVFTGTSLWLFYSLYLQFLFNVSWMPHCCGRRPFFVCQRIFQPTLWLSSLPPN